MFVSNQSEAPVSCSGGAFLIPVLGQQRGTDLSSRPVWSIEFQADQGLHSETLAGSDVTSPGVHLRRRGEMRSPSRNKES